MSGAPAFDAGQAALDLQAVELFILRRMRERPLGQHASVFSGAGVEVAGLHPWQAGDRVSSVDWAQSSLTNFNPLLVREFEPDHRGTILAAVDISLSTRCGADGTTIGASVARVLALLGMSASFMNDAFGTVTFDDRLRSTAFARPATGKAHVHQCIDLLRRDRAAGTCRAVTPLAAAVRGYLRRPALLPVISDFLFADPATAIKEFAALNAIHDVCLMMVDARWAFAPPRTSSGWIRVRDAESGRVRVLSRRQLHQMTERVGEWQQQTLTMARRANLDIVSISPQGSQLDATVVDFIAARRLRRRTA